MLTSFIAGIVQFSMRHAYPVIIAALLAAAGAAAYVATHFAISTDVSKLIDQQGVWAQRSRAIDEAFPQRAGLTLAVIEAPAAEFADQAAAELAVRLAQQPERFGTVSRPGAGAFFAHNGLLFVDAADLQRLATQLGSAAPLLSRLAADPSLRGVASLLSLTLGTPLLSGQLQLADLAPLLERSAGTIDAVLAGQPAALSWRALVAADTQPRSFVAVHPVPDYGALEAGAAAASEIRRLAVELQLAERYGARVQLTGPRPLADDEFASVRQGAAPNAVATLLAVLLILWLAVRSGKLILAVFVTLIVGLIVTAALGLLMVGALNMISVAFAVLFVGIGVDFGIQFAVRYREERHRADGVEAALAAAARGIALPLSLAAAATAASFFSFLPTAYRGISELGLIAGVGILLVAFPSALTLLPALITVLRPKGEPAAPGFRWLAPVDRYTDRHRWPLLAGTLLLVLAGLPLLAHLRFDFDPLHLKDPHSESMATLLRLADRPEAGINDAQLLSASLADADAAAQRLRRLPEVGRALTLSSFVPADQPAKRAQIEALAVTLRPSLEQMPASAGVDAARVLALNRAAGMLDNAVADHPDHGTALLPAQHLAATLRRLAAADAATRDRAEQAICAPLKLALDALRALLAPQPLRLDTLPAEIRAEWMTADGRALVNISPRFAPAASSAADDAQLRRFSAALLRAEPEAIGGPISILHSADTIVRAFVEAGVWALLSITVLLWLALRRLGDVLRTLVPLLVSAVATLELSVLLGWPLNFANIIALPLLLGIGVAFKIYYVMAWRSGKTDLLQSSLTQAVILSAATTATAFGSLWLSHHPGTASMGRLLALSLLCTLFGAVFFQPMLMGRPRARQR